MSGALRRQARATGVARIGKCIIAEMSRPWVEDKPRDQLQILSAVRLREIETIIRARHGHYLPDPSGTDDVDLVYAYLQAVAGTLHPVGPWALRWAPWFDDEAVLQRAEALQQKLLNGRNGPKLLPADAVAMMLFVRLVERNRLGLKTIGACDVSKIARTAVAKDRKRERDRKRQAAKRLADGRTPRDKSISATEPWLAEGISRRTWYRNQRGTNSSRAKIDISGGDTFVPPATSVDKGDEGDAPSITRADLQRSNDTETVGRRSGSGDESPAGEPWGGATWRQLQRRVA